MKVLITGGAGFIGSHLADACLARGDQVILMDNLSTGRRENIAHLEKTSSCQIVVDSILNRGILKELTATCDLVFHMAAAVGVKYILDHPFGSLETNTKGTEGILEIAREFGKKVVLASSSEVYGKHDDAPLREEDDLIYGPPSRWRWSYAASKLIDEYLGLAYHHEFGLPTIMARLFNTVGPRQTGFYGMVIPRFVQQALRNEPITVYGDGNQRRAFTDVDDAITALLKLSESKEAVGQVINIGGSEEISIEALANRIREKTNSRSPIVKIPYEKAYGSYGRDYEDMPRRLASTDKLFRLIGFRPTTSLDQILEKVTAFQRGGQ